MAKRAAASRVSHCERVALSAVAGGAGAAPDVTVDSGGVGAGGATNGGTRSGGARSRGVGAGGVCIGGASSRGAGAGVVGAGGASPGGDGAGCASAGGASSGGAGVGGAGTGGASFGGGGVGGASAVGASTEETGAGGTTITTPTASPHRYGTRLQALRQLEREEQERQELQQLDQQQQQQQPPPQPPLLQQLFPLSSPLFVPHDWTSRCPPRARPSSPFADLCTVLFRSSPRHSPHVSVLPSPLESSLTVSSHPITDYYCAARHGVSRVLATLVTNLRDSPSSVSALSADIVDFASTRRLDYATRVVAAPPPHPLSVGGESALGCDVLEDRQYEQDFLAAASPSLCATLLSPEGDPYALDIPTPRTYRTYIDAVPPPRANIVDGMWLFKVKRSPGSPPVFKARYVAKGFSQREGGDFFHTFAPTPKMTTLRMLLHVATQQDYELHSLDFFIAFLQGRLHEEIWLRRPPGFTDSFPPGTQWSLRRPVYGLRRSPREWHDTLRSTLRDLGFCPSSADPSLFVCAGSTPFFRLQ
ncbi:unnamed protein product [Closterium sp. NIES-54]